MMDVHTVYVGERLGLYRALADSDATTSAELAAATATDRMPGKGRSGDAVRLRLSISALFPNLDGCSDSARPPAVSLCARLRERRVPKGITPGHRVVADGVVSAVPIRRLLS